MGMWGRLWGAVSPRPSHTSWDRDKAIYQETADRLRSRAKDKVADPDAVKKVKAHWAKGLAAIMAKAHDDALDIELEFAHHEAKTEWLKREAADLAYTFKKSPYMLEFKPRLSTRR